jgi:hypothetical protein
MREQVPIRVKAVNAIVALVDFAASSAAAHEGESAQKDAVIRQLTEQLARVEAEKKAVEDRIREEVAAPIRDRVVALLSTRDRLADDREVSLLDGELNDLRKLLQ